MSDRIRRAPTATGAAPAKWSADPRLGAAAAVHAALGEPLRLAIVEELVCSDRSPAELGRRFGLASNLVAHHLDVLECAGIVVRTNSAGDGRRRYVRLDRSRLAELGIRGRRAEHTPLFLCTYNSARSQLAAALWTASTGRPAASAGTRPARRVHRGAVAAARRAGVSLAGATPMLLTQIPCDAQVVTVCDLVHEELTPGPDWWHWSIADPAVDGDAAAFDTVVAELRSRIDGVVQRRTDETTR
jgi:protein-tyrosine-phosphatase/DNA-binding HxlR family transcriptional regulator